MVEKLAFEAHLVRAHARSEGKSEVGAPEPTRHQPELEQRLAQASRPDPRIPLADRLDVVETAAHARHQAEVGLGTADHLLLTEGEPRARELTPKQRDVPRVGISRRKRSEGI